MTSPHFDSLAAGGNVSAVLAIVLDAAIKGLVVLIAAAVVTLAMRRASAAHRHAVWAIAVAALCLLPVWSALAPGCWGVTILPAALERQQPSSDVHDPPRRAAFAVEDRPEEILLGHRGQPRVAHATAPAQVIREASAASRWAGWLLLLWTTGVLVLLARLVVGLVIIWHQGRIASPITDTGWRAIAEELARRYGIRRQVSCRLGTAGTMPATWGVVRPTIVLPVGATEWPEPRVRAVLLHELAHVVRCDFLVQTLAQVACALYWFNPLIWYADRRLRREGEQASDDLVIAAGLTPASYATHLVEVVASARREREPSFAALAMARHSELEGRVRAVLDSGRSHARLSARRLAAMLLAGVMFLVPVGLIRVEARAHDAPRLERLPEGVKIEVIGVSSHPSGAATWWKPHGKPLETAPCDPPAETVKVAGKDVREIVVRITGLPKDAGLEWSTSQSRSRRMAIPRRAGQPVTELQAVIAEFPPGQSTCDVHFDLALGEWSTAQVFDGHGTIAIQKDDQEVFFGRAREFNEGTAIAVAHNIAERAVRVIAIDEDGKEHQPRNRSSGGSGHLYGLDVEFNLPPSKIREYRLQSRPVGRYEIKNVALQRTKSGA